MPRLEDAAIRMSLESNQVKYLVGHADSYPNGRHLAPYDPIVCKFIADLSTALRADDDAKRLPDVMSFAFWCRKANIERLKNNFDSSHTRLGLGLVFHIAPSNIPINFAFSFVFSLLAGNANVVRVPSTNFPQTEIICRLIKRIFEKSAYCRIAEMTAFVQYGHDEAITTSFSSRCNARVIWGGDIAIENIRRSPLPQRSREIVFADRYSICVIASNKILEASEPKMCKLASAFYNDVYLMDQNACSSPHLIVWLGNERASKIAQNKFWESIGEIVSVKYDLQPANAFAKYALLCEAAINVDGITNLERVGNLIYRIRLDSLPKHLDTCRGKFGLFYEYITHDLNDIASSINTKYQTLTYFGVEKTLLRDFVTQNDLSGIDRVVPIGEALDIDIVWDGYDVVGTLSRIVDIR